MSVIPPLNINANTVTVSGYSSGGYMAGKVTLIDPELIKGAGLLITGAPVLGFEPQDPSGAVVPPDIDVNAYLAKLRELRSKKKIGPRMFLNKKPIFQFMGKKDPVVKHQWTHAMTKILKT